MSRINRVPKGLQDFLGSANFGDNPSELSGVVAPTLDIFKFLKMDRRTIIMTAAANAAVDGVVVTQDVPLGETWLIDILAVRVALAGGAAPYQAQFCCTTTNTIGTNFAGTTQHPLAYLGEITPNSNAAVSSGFFAFTKHYSTPLVLFGGERINWQVVNGDYSGTKQYTCVGYVNYTKLLV